MTARLYPVLEINLTFQDLVPFDSIAAAVRNAVQNAPGVLVDDPSIARVESYLSDIALRAKWFLLGASPATVFLDPATGDYAFPSPGAFGGYEWAEEGAVKIADPTTQEMLAHPKTAEMLFREAEAYGADRDNLLDLESKFQRPLLVWTRLAPNHIHHAASLAEAFEILKAEYFNVLGPDFPLDFPVPGESTEEWTEALRVWAETAVKRLHMPSLADRLVPTISYR